MLTKHGARIWEKRLDSRFRRIGSPLSGIVIGKWVFGRNGWGCEGLPKDNGRGTSWIFSCLDLSNTPACFDCTRSLFCVLQLVARFESANGFLDVVKTKNQ